MHFRWRNWLKISYIGNSVHCSNLIASISRLDGQMWVVCEPCWPSNLWYIDGSIDGWRVRAGELVSLIMYSFFNGNKFKILNDISEFYMTTFLLTIEPRFAPLFFSQKFENSSDGLLGVLHWFVLTLVLTKNFLGSKFGSRRLAKLETFESS